MAAKSNLGPSILEFSMGTTGIVSMTSITSGTLSLSTYVPLTRAAISSITPTSIIVDSLDYTYMTGMYASTSTVPLTGYNGILSSLSLPSTPADNDYNMFIIKFDTLGNVYSYTTFYIKYPLITYPVTLLDSYDNIYNVGGFTANTTTFPLYNFTTGGSPSYTSSLSCSDTGYTQLYIIKYSSAGIVLAWNYIDCPSQNINPSTVYISQQPGYLCSGQLYVTGYLLGSASTNFRQFAGTVGNTYVSSNTTVGSASLGAFIVNYDQDIFRQLSISISGDFQYFVTSMISDSNYLYVGAFLSGGTTIFSFSCFSSIGVTSLIASSAGSNLTRYSLLDGALITSMYSSAISFYTSMCLNSGLLYVAGMFLGASDVTLSNLDSSPSTFTLTIQDSWMFSFIYTQTGQLYKITYLSSNLYNQPIVYSDSYGNTYLMPGTLSADSSILDYSSTSTTQSTLSMFTSETCIIKYNPSGQAIEYLSYLATPVIYVDAYNYLYAAAAFSTEPFAINNFTTTGTGSQVYVLANSDSDGMISKWSQSGTVVYLSLVDITGAQNPVAYSDLVTKNYVDGSFEYLVESGTLASSLPNIVSVLVPQQVYLQYAVDSILCNSSISSTATDYVNGYIYVSGIYYGSGRGSGRGSEVVGSDSSCYNIDGTFNNLLPASSGSPNSNGTLSGLPSVFTYVLKYDLSGKLLASTSIAAEGSGQLVVDAAGFVYLSGSLINTTTSSTSTVYVYDFSSSSVTGLSKALLPYGNYYQYIIKWSSSGLFDSLEATEAYSSFNSIGLVQGIQAPMCVDVVDGYIYAAINSIVGNSVGNFTSNTLVTGNSMSLSSGIGVGSHGTFTQIGAKLVGSGTSGIDGSQQGYSVSLYGDTLAVGGLEDNNDIGATWIFTLNEGVWTQQGSKLVGSGTSGTDGSQQGNSVSLYGDTLAVGGPADNNYSGATWIFTRTNGVWTQQGSKLVGSGTSGTDGSQQGCSVSLYGDTLAVGGPYDNNNIGATWIFTRTEGVWTQQGSKLVGSGTSGTVGPYQGQSVSLYGDTLAVGGYEDNNNIGATWIFTRTNGVWTQQGSKLVGSGTSGTDGSYQGYSVSLYGDTLAVGGPVDNNNIGATWIFTRTEGVWTQQGSKLVGSGTTNGTSQGLSVSLYGDTFAVGGYGNNKYIGATWIFTRTGGVWTQQGSKLVGSGTKGTESYQGYSVSLYGDTLAVGGSEDNNATGATWIFQNITCGVAKWSQSSGNILGLSPINTFVSTSMITDSLSNVYCSGVVTQAQTPLLVYNLTGVANSNYAFSISQTNPGLALVQWNSYGQATGYTYVLDLENTLLSLDPQNNLYCIGIYLSPSAPIPVYGFSTSGSTSYLLNLMTTSSASVAVAKWSSNGNINNITTIYDSNTTYATITNDSASNTYLGFNYSATSNTLSICNLGTSVTALSLPTTSTLNVWTETGTLQTAHLYAPMVLLPNGNPIIIGGSSTLTSTSSTVSEIYSVELATWTTTGSLNIPRQSASACQLQNGTILVAGGYTGGQTSLATSTCEIYNPTTALWTTTGITSMTRASSSPSMGFTIGLYTGKVLAVGGTPIVSSTVCELYDYTTGVWTTTGSLNNATYAAQLALLPNGNVLNVSSYNCTSEIYDVPSALWYTTGTYSQAVTIGTAAAYMSACNLQDGKVVFIGGSVSNTSLIPSMIYDPKYGSWNFACAMPSTVPIGTYMQLMASGYVLNAGQGTTCAIYSQTTNTWVTTGSLNVSRSFPAGILLNNSQVLVAGGSTSLVTELYNAVMSSFAIVCYDSGGVALEYVVMSNTLTTSSLYYGPSLEIDDDGYLNAVFSVGSGTSVYNLTTTGTGSGTALQTASSPISTSYIKWSLKNGIIYLGPYMQDFSCYLPTNSTGEQMSRTIIPVTDNYRYSVVDSGTGATWNISGPTKLFYNGFNWINSN